MGQSSRLFAQRVPVELLPDRRRERRHKRGGHWDSLCVSERGVVDLQDRIPAQDVRPDRRHWRRPGGHPLLSRA